MDQIVTTSCPSAIARSAFARQAWVGAGLRVVGFCALTALAAQVRIPVPGTDVPMTLQLLAVLLAGLALPIHEAAASMTLYLAAGAAGLPVWAPQSAGLWGPTGGYLAGFLLAVALIGLIRGRSNASNIRLLLAAASGAAVVLAAGATWRALGSGDWIGALTTGTAAFVPKTIVEVFLAVAIARHGSRWTARATGQGLV